MGTCALVRPDQKEATIQLMTQAIQIMVKSLVGHVQTQPPTIASAISPALGMLQNLGGGYAHDAGDGLLQHRADRPGRIAEFRSRLVNGQRRCTSRNAD